AYVVALLRFNSSLCGRARFSFGLYVLLTQLEMSGPAKYGLTARSVSNKLFLDSPSLFHTRATEKRKRKKPGMVVPHETTKSAAGLKRSSLTECWWKNGGDSILDCLPVTVLCEIVAYLSIIDQKSFARSCHTAEEATRLFWRSRKVMVIVDLLKRQFPNVDEWKWTSLHNVLDEVAFALRQIPSYSINSLDIRPFFKLHIDDLNLLANRANKSALEMFGSTQHLDIRGCALHSNEMLWFSSACPNIFSLAVTASCIEVDERTREDAAVWEYLRTSLLGYWTLKRANHLSSKRLRLVLYLLRLFPLLQKIYLE
uniref:F-box domain-containing protein n=1 Tax=Parascaris univalens TaxID=6257 RepID=A0A915A1P3_PARUN